METVYHTKMKKKTILLRQKGGKRMKRTGKKIVSLLLTGALGLTLFAGCGETSGSSGENEFTMWIYSADAEGRYESYDDNPVIQWLNNQYWDVENHTIGEEGNGEQVKLSFMTPIAGAESDNWNTMIGTGEYPELLDLTMGGSPQVLYEDGVLMELTDLVEEYMPNYVAYLEQDEQLKKLATTTDEDGKVHYYAIYGLKDSMEDIWEGHMYRRDWVVKYCEPTQYIWDWDSAYVQENGHPEVTPLERAISEGDLNGWKENEQYGTQFTFTQGDDPDNDWEDNVIFPSGTSDPITISDWEWMLEGFQEAIEDRGWADDSDAYPTTITYAGHMQTGDLVSSFGGGTAMWSVNRDGKVEFGGTGDNFRAYVEAMNTWYENGWLDQVFNTRASEVFFNINANGFSQGKVGLQLFGTGMLGTTIRETCANEEDQRDAMLMGCALPINDVYGSEDQMYKAPDSFYGATRVGGAMGFTTKCEDKDLSAILTMLNWMYTMEGGLTVNKGLSKEQYESMDFDPDIYAEDGLTEGAYTIQQGEDGKEVIVMNYDSSSSMMGQMIAQRLQAYLQINANGEGLDYSLERGLDEVYTHAIDVWMQFENTGYIMNYNSLMNSDQNNVYSRANTNITEYLAREVPNLIINGLDEWDAYCQGLNALNPDEATEIYREIVE